MGNNKEVENKLLVIGLCSVILAYFVFSFIPVSVSQGINDLPAWYTYVLSPKNFTPLKVVGIAIDDYSINKIGQRWPWRRTVYAQLIKILDQEKAETIGIDLAFVGDSEDKFDDQNLADTLKNTASRVVLSYYFDYEKAMPVLPLAELKNSAYSIGMLNTPVDKDSKIRRLRGYVLFKDQYHYSFSLALAASFLKQKPSLLARLLPPGQRDSTYFIKYLVKPTDIIELNFYDALNNLGALKQRYGADFLNGALVLVYPKSEITHDIYNTPLGKMPGGLLHLNGTLNIISGKFMRNDSILFIPFTVISCIAVFYILRFFNFSTGIILILGVLLVEFFFIVILNAVGIRINYALAVFSSLVFFIFGSLYKQLNFLSQILEIKNKAALDSFSNLHTLQYFYYRLSKANQEIHFGKDLFLVFAYMESLKKDSEAIEQMLLKETWKDISSFLLSQGKFWALYSQDEVVGCMLSSGKDILKEANFIRTNLQICLSKINANPKVKLACIKLKRTYSLKSVFFFISNKLKSEEADIKLFKEEELNDFAGSSNTANLNDFEGVLDSLSEDIEAKNRKLQSLIDSLSKETAKNKEAFLQIITALVKALEARDPYTEGHSDRVSNYALKLADKLGWSNEQKVKLKQAALLHDLGKIGIPDGVLHKKGQLDPMELEFIRKHEIIGVKILEPLKDLNEILPWILYHHERWDGKGYPHGLGGDAIPEGAQIISLADVFDAITTGRDYKNAFSVEEAVTELIKSKGTQFNPALVDIFVSTIKKH